MSTACPLPNLQIFFDEVNAIAGPIIASVTYYMLPLLACRRSGDGRALVSFED